MSARGPRRPQRVHHRRRQGRGFNHAKAFADAGANVALLDITEPIENVYRTRRPGDARHRRERSRKPRRQSTGPAVRST